MVTLASASTTRGVMCCAPRRAAASRAASPSNVNAHLSASPRSTDRMWSAAPGRRTSSRTRQNRSERSRIESEHIWVATHRRGAAGMRRRRSPTRRVWRERRRKGAARRAPQPRRRRPRALAQPHHLRRHRPQQRQRRWRRRPRPWAATRGLAGRGGAGRWARRLKAARVKQNERRERRLFKHNAAARTPPQLLHLPQ